MTPNTSLDMTASMKKTATLRFCGDDAVAERQRQERHERAAKRDVRCEPKQEVVGVGRDRVFLAEQLDAVGEGLQPAELAADAGRPEPVLNAAGRPCVPAR